MFSFHGESGASACRWPSKPWARVRVRVRVRVKVAEQALG